jgi:hypothetical protein
MKYFLENYDCDYVVWLDSDAVIANMDIPFEYIISKCNYKDIIISHDDSFKLLLQILSAGAFFIKNNEVGRSFINDCIHFIEQSSDCIVDAKEQGLWAGICYEQGVMNYLIKTIKKYRKNVYVTSKSIIYNTGYYFNNYNLDFGKYYILHLAGKGNTERAECFKEILSYNNE